MTDPVERERIKYRREKLARQGALINRALFWLPVAFFAGIALLVTIFGNH